MTNFKNTIKLLKQSGEDCAVIPDASDSQYIYTVFCIKGESDVGYYAYRHGKSNNKEDTIGEGATARVYKAFRINPRTGKEDKNAISCAVKLSLNAAPSNEKTEESASFKEAVIQSPYCRTAKPVKNEYGQYITLMEYVPGISLKKLLDDINNPDSIIVNLTFRERIRLIRQLYEWINLFHHQSPATGKAIAHLDLKEDNIHIFFNPKTKKWELYVLDFGSAIQLDHEDKMQDTNLTRGGWHIQAPERTNYIDENDYSVSSERTNLYDEHEHRDKAEKYFVDEQVASGQAGTATDGFALSYLLMRLLGATRNAYDYLHFPNKRYSSVALTYSNMIGWMKENNKLPYDMIGFLKNVELPEITFDDQSFNLAMMMQEFVQRMSAPDYHLRQSTDEQADFIITIDNLCELLETHPEDEKTKNAYLAKLCLLSAGLGQAKIGEKPIDYYEYHQGEKRYVKLGVKTKDKTFVDFDFHHDAEKNRELIQTCLDGKLDNTSAVIQSIRDAEEKQFSALMRDGRLVVKEELDVICQLPKDLLSKHLNDEHMEMILDVALRGIKVYESRNGNHLSFWQQFDKERGKTRVINYKELLESESHNLFTKMVILYALLESNDGHKLQEDVAMSFTLLFKADFKAETLKKAVFNIIETKMPNNMTMAGIKTNVRQIYNKLNNYALPETETLAALNNTSLEVPPSLHARQRRLSSR